MKKKDNENDDIEFVAEDGEGSEMTSQDKLKKLRQELKTCKGERDDNLASLQRARADYVNLKREMDEGGERTRTLVKEKFILDLLPTIDSFDMAMKNKEAWESVDKNWRTGVEYIYAQLTKLLEEYEVTEISDEKSDFDPEIHEPLETIETGNKKEDGTIAEIRQKGYKMDDKVIRPAKIIIKKFINSN